MSNKWQYCYPTCTERGKCAAAFYKSHENNAILELHPYACLLGSQPIDCSDSPIQHKSLWNNALATTQATLLFTEDFWWLRSPWSKGRCSIDGSQCELNTTTRCLIQGFWHLLATQSGHLNWYCVPFFSGILASSCLCAFPAQNMLCSKTNCSGCCGNVNRLPSC